MSFEKVKDDFKNGKLPKEDYINRMHEFHQSLFEYSEFIKETDIKLIEISDDSVIMTTRHNDIKLYCDKDDKRIIPIEILNFDIYENEILDMMNNLLEDDFNVFDIGGNIGWYALNLVKAKKNVTVLTFEPIPKTFNYLTRNISINNASNVYPHNFGFSSEEKELTFYYYPEGSGNASSANVSERDDVDIITCQVKKLDNFVSEKNIRVDMIKCDVEGAELYVYQGGIETIRKDKPIIFTELLRKWSAKFNYNPNEVIKLLKGLDYKCFTIKGNRLDEFFEMDESTVETNFLFLHAEKHSSKITQFTSI